MRVGSIALSRCRGIVAAFAIGIGMTGAASSDDGLADAQESNCRFFVVAAAALNIFEEPRGLASFVAALRRDDVVCVAADRKVGDVVWDANENAHACSSFQHGQRVGQALAHASEGD